MEENTPIKVYIKINENKEVIDINSEIFIHDLTDWVYIDEGEGDRYAHAQSQYLDEPLINDNGNNNYLYIDNKIIKR